MLQSLSKLALDIDTGSPIAGAKRKLVTDQQIGDSFETTIDAIGSVALSMSESTIDSVDFIRNVDTGTRAWFFARLAVAMQPDAEVPQMTTKKSVDWHKMKAWQLGRDIWAALSQDMKAEFYSHFELDMPSGRVNLFIPANRSKVVKAFAVKATLGNGGSARLEALDLYLKDRLTYVKQGDSRMGMSAMHKSWSNKGFGKWAHIMPGVGLRAALVLRSKLDYAGVETQLVGGSHMIYKPPGGTELSAHTDGPRPMTMITLLEALFYKNKRYPTTIEWMQTHGIQSLVHFDGGSVDGYTYTIGPMNPKRLYICLKAVQNGSLNVPDDQLFPKTTKNDEEDDDAEANCAKFDTTVWTRLERFLTGGTGPSFLNWKENLNKFNEVLAANDEPEPLREIPIRPPEGTPAGAFAAVWPVGFPHGSAPNKQRRITTTASLAVVSPNSIARDERVPQRVCALATIADEESSVEARAHAKKKISTQTEPFAGGKTHLRPEYAGSWFDPTLLASGVGGFYKSIAPTHEDAEAFVKAWNEGDPSHAPTGDEWLAYEMARRSMPRGGVARRPRCK